jgi:hypothetical protein
VDTEAAAAMDEKNERKVGEARRTRLWRQHQRRWGTTSTQAQLAVQRAGPRDDPTLDSASRRGEQVEV